MKAVRLWTRFLLVVPLVVGCTETGLEPSPEVSIPAPEYASLTVGEDHSCALDVEGRAFCWGSNHWGQLGVGSTAPSEQPMPVAGGHRFLAIDAGFGRTCGITTEGALLCWGNTVGGVDYRLLPVEIGPAGVEFASLDVAYLACALTATGIVYCGNHAANFTPEFPDRVWRSVAVAASHGCLISVDDEGFCWGYNWSRQLGFEASGYYENPVAAPGIDGWRELRPGNDYTCGTTTAGVTSCWGIGLDAALGTDTIPEDDAWIGVAEPVRLAGGSLDVAELVTAEATGSRFVTCGRTELGGRGATVCWGDGHLPLNLDFGRTDWDEVGFGQAHGCGRVEHRIYCWRASAENDWDILTPDLAPREIPAPSSEWRDA